MRQRRLLVLMGTMVLLAGCAQGEYRMPYGNGTSVEVLTDHVTHSSPHAYMYDIQAQNAASASIVAAAPGWIRFIDDSHEEPTSDNNYVWIEHPYPFCPVDASRANWPGKPGNYGSTCIPCDRGFCNEWTTYAHMTKDSVRVDAGLSEGDWVEAGDFLGYEDRVGEASTDHLHWHVAVIPPNTTPTYNGYYQAYVDATGKLPEVIPIVCHEGGLSVLWRTGIYTAAGCPAGAPSSPAKSFFPAPPEPRSPLAAVLQAIASISDEGTWIALGDPRLMLRTRQLVSRMEPDFQDLMHLGRARVSNVELKMVLELLVEYERRSAEIGRVLEPIRRQLESPSGRQNLGIVMEALAAGLD